jgi:replicative DNA helicase
MAILATQKVLTLDYWKIAEDLKPGDIVFDRAGNPTTVKLVQHYRALNCYKVLFKDGLTVAGDANLQLPLEDEKYRKRAQDYKGVLKFRRPLVITSISKLLDTTLYGRENRLEYSVPTAGALQLPHQDLPVPPFIFGFWFFNRKTDHGLRPPTEFDEYIRAQLHDGGYLCQQKGRNFQTTPSIRVQMSLYSTNKIPNNYLLASPEQRQQLLSGILMSKSRTYLQDRDIFRFSSFNKTVVRQVQYLAESLGCKTTLMDGKFFTLYIKTKLQLMPNQQLKPIKVRQHWRLIEEVYEIVPQGCVHIETTTPDTGFLVGEGFIACR